MAGPARRAAVLARAAGAVRAGTGGAEAPPAAPEFNGQAMVDKVLSELAVSGGPFVLIIDALHELSSGYGENAWAGVKAHLDTVTSARCGSKRLGSHSHSWQSRKNVRAAVNWAAFEGASSGFPRPSFSPAVRRA